MQKFLVIQTAFIGDVVLATAILEKLNKCFPDAVIDLLVRKGNEDMFEQHPFLRRVWVWNKKQNKISNLLKLAAEIRKENYHEVINLQRYFSTGLLTVLSGAKTTRGFSKNPLSAFFTKSKAHHISKEGTLHEVGRNQLLIEEITDQTAEKPKLYPTAKHYSKVKNFKEAPYICCAPASVWFTKQYPEAHWSQFIMNCDPALKIYLLGGPNDKALCERIIKASGNTNAFSLCGDLSFLESAALMKDALMNFVNDSSPMHFASSVNAPVTAIFCSTVLQFGYGPLSDDRTIVQIDYPLYCRPCGLHGHKKCPESHFKCALEIPHHRLIEIVNEHRHN